MDFLFIIAMFVIFTIIDNLASRKKPRVPPPQNRDGQPNFDIPTLANDPNLPGEEVPIFIESPAQVEVRPKEFTPPPPKKKVEQIREVNDDELALNLTPSTVMNTFILAELIDKPKALRRRYR